MSENGDNTDYERIAKIAKEASDVSFTRMEKTIEKCMDRKFDSLGMGNPDKVRKIMIYGEQCMENKQNMRNGFFNGLGGHFATALITIGAVWVATTKGMFN